METNKISKLKVNHFSGSMVHVNGENCVYTHHGYAIFRLQYKEIEASPNILELLLKKGFTKMFDRFNDSLVDFTLENINEQRKFKTLDFVVLKRDLDLDEISENFYYQITLQICGKHIISFYPLTKGMTTVDENIITFKTYDGNPYWEYGPEADALFREKYISENEGIRDGGRNKYEYRKHISEIEKIFLTKRFRDVEQIGSDNEHRFNGKTEVIELDLRNPDMEIYEKMRAIDNCIEIEWEKE